MSRFAIPKNVTGIRLCKVVKGDLVICEHVQFVKGQPAVATVMNRASISGEVGPIGETGDFWADLLLPNDDWIETIKLDRKSWNIIKNRWAKCKIDRGLLS